MSTIELTTETDAPTERERWLSALRDLSYLIDEKDLPEPLGVTVYGFSDHPMRVTWHFTASQADLFAETVRKLPKNGPVSKKQDDAGTWRVEFDVPGWPVHAKVVLVGACELVDTGEVEEYEDVEVVTPAETRTVVKTRPVLERQCPPSLMKLGAEASA